MLQRFSCISFLFKPPCTDNFFSLVLVSDWLIFCCRNLNLNLKEMKMIKTQFFNEKQQQKCHKSIYKLKLVFFTLNLVHSPVM